MEGDYVCGKEKSGILQDVWSSSYCTSSSPFICRRILSTSKTFLSADREESSAKLEPSETDQDFQHTPSTIRLDADNSQPQHDTDGITHFLPFYQKNCHSQMQVSCLVLRNVMLIKIQAD